MFKIIQQNPADMKSVKDAQYKLIEFTNANNQTELAHLLLQLKKQQSKFAKISIDGLNEIKDANGRTLAMIAAEKGHFNLLSLFSTYGVDLEQRQKVTLQSESAIAFIERKLQQEPNNQLFSEFNETLKNPLQIMNEHTIELFLRNYGNLSAHYDDMADKRPLVEVIKDKNINDYRFGYDIRHNIFYVQDFDINNTIDEDGNNLLILAIMHSKKIAFTSLISYGADPAHRCVFKKECSALDLANRALQLNPTDKNLEVTCDVLDSLLRTQSLAKTPQLFNPASFALQSPYNQELFH